MARTLAATAAALTVLAFGAAPPASAGDAPYDVLVFSKTTGFRHDAIPSSIQMIRELGAADGTTGSVYGFRAPDIAARDAALNPPGEWNTLEVLVEGERVQVFLNGTRINDFTNTDPARSLTSGHVGIQNHGDGDDVSFRNIRIRELGGGGVGPIVGAGGTCVDVNGALVQLATCDGGAGQNWTAQSGGALTSSGKCLDASGGSTANGTQLIIWSCHGGTNQRWTLP